MTRNFLHKMRDARLRSRLSRRHFLWAAAIGVGLAVAYNAALPLLISTADVRPTVEHMLDAWSGGKSRITGNPEISFWPEPTLTCAPRRSRRQMAHRASSCISAA